MSNALLRNTCRVKWHADPFAAQVVSLYPTRMVLEGVEGHFEDEVVELQQVESVRDAASNYEHAGIVVLVAGGGGYTVTQIELRFETREVAAQWMHALRTLTEPAASGGAALPPAAARPQPTVTRDAEGRIAYDIGAVEANVAATQRAARTALPSETYRGGAAISAGAFPSPRFARLGARQTWATQMASPGRKATPASTLAVRSALPGGAQWSASLRSDFAAPGRDRLKPPTVAQFGYGSLRGLRSGQLAVALSPARRGGRKDARPPPPPMSAETAETLQRYLQWAETTARTRRILRTSLSLVKASQNGYFLLQLIAALRPRSGTALRAAEKDVSMVARKHESNNSNMKMAVDIVLRGPVNKARIPPPSYLASGNSDAVACFIEEIFQSFELRQVKARASASVRWFSNITKRYGKELAARNLNAPYYGLARKVRGGTLFACVLHYFCGDGRRSFPAFSLAGTFEVPENDEQEMVNLPQVWEQFRSLGILVLPPPERFLQFADLDLILVQIDRLYERFRGESTALPMAGADRYGASPFITRIDISGAESGTWHEQLVARSGDTRTRGFRYALRVSGITYRAPSGYALAMAGGGTDATWQAQSQQYARSPAWRASLGGQGASPLVAPSPAAAPPAAEPAVSAAVQKQRKLFSFEDRRARAMRRQ